MTDTLLVAAGPDGVDNQRIRIGTDRIILGKNAFTATIAANSIVLNATGITLNSANTSSFYVNPVRSNTATNILYYDTATGEISYNPPSVFDISTITNQALFTTSSVTFANLTITNTATLNTAYVGTASVRLSSNQIAGDQYDFNIVASRGITLDSGVGSIVLTGVAGGVLFANIIRNPIRFTDQSTFEQGFISTTATITTATITNLSFGNTSTTQVGYAKNILGNGVYNGSLLYQSAPNTTGFLGQGLPNWIMVSNGEGNAPSFNNTGSIFVGNANKSTNIAGGSANRIPYQTAANTTNFIGTPTTTGTYLTWTGSDFAWNTISDQSLFTTSSVTFAAVNATTATITNLSFGNTSTTQVGFAADVLGGVAGQLLYQIGPNDTGFINTGSVYVGNAAQANILNPANTATQQVGFAVDVLGGAANQIHYQISANDTGFIAAPTTATTYLAWTGTNYTWQTVTIPDTISPFLLGCL
jgi:hypothetical protein